ncbi:MAG: tetratricopeptide repeat protein [Leptolyngbyaceae cyanobacterium bins.59]|nr:tetratricopeptide repeat protein [Leptolyngbyaceae cyanobacterium bins.59]
MPLDPARLNALLEQVSAAFDHKDYRTAAQILKTLTQQAPQHLWVQLYVGRMQEVSGKLRAAENIYRQLLRQTSSPRLALQARQGLQRVETAEREQRQQAIEQASHNPQNTGLGFLVLEPVTEEVREKAVQNFARITRLDPYVARMRLSSKGWQLFRTGTAAELQVYGQEFQKAGIPAIWASQAEIEAIHVFRVCYLQTIHPQPSVVCESAENQRGSLSFDWSEVSQQVRGQLPVFEKVVDLGAWGKLKRTERTQDYVQVCDLHLPGRKCILRFCDLTYQFQEGAVLSEHANFQATPQTTVRMNWNNLLSFLDHELPHVPVRSNFKSFADTALDHRVPLSRLKSQFDLPRKKETYWDPAFHLYSSLLFLKAEKG